MTENNEPRPGANWSGRQSGQQTNQPQSSEITAQYQGEISFVAAMRAAGLQPPGYIEPDKFHRFPGVGKKNGNTAGWCKLFDDGRGGVFGDYSTNFSESWQAESGRPLSQEERAAFRQQIEESRKQAEEKRWQEQKAAAAQSRLILQDAKGDPATHPYTMKKGVPLGLFVTRGAWKQRGWTDALLAKIFDETGAVVSIQAISPDGDKDFLSGGKKKGCLYPFGKLKGATGRAIIGEGIATVAAAVKATGLPGAAAFDAGNLAATAETVRKLAPEAEIIILADNDRAGIEGSVKAAKAVNGRVAYTGIDLEHADFWDVLNDQGAEAVRALIDAAKPTEQSELTMKYPGEQQKDSPHQVDIARRPVPLPDLPPVSPFDFDLLPDKLTPWVKDISERLQCPPDYVAIGAMVNLAAVIGRKIGIRPQQRADWTVVPNLWGLIVGRPGVMKSPALEATGGPLDRLIAEAMVVFQDAEKGAKAQKVMAKLRTEAREKEVRLKLKDNPDADVLDLLIEEENAEPTLRRYKTNDTTAASLGELLRQNPNGLLVYRDEMVSLLKNLDREDNAGERGFFLTSWNGDSSYTLDRIGRGLHLHIEACCVSLLGGTQPGKLSEYISRAVKGGVGDDGLIQRFGLMIWPDVNPTWQNIDRYPDTAAKNAAFEIFDRLDKLNPQGVGAAQDTGFDGVPEGIPYLRLAPDALELFTEWRTNLETRLRSGELHPALESHFAKYRKLVPALALIIHLTDDGVGPVTEASTLKALAWAEYLEGHARRCYASVTQADVQAAKAILIRIAKGDLKSPFGSRDVWRPGWTGLDREAAHKGLSMLVDYGHLTTETVKTDGPDATLYHVVEVRL